MKCLYKTDNTKVVRKNWTAFFVFYQQIINNSISMKNNCKFAVRF